MGPGPPRGNGTSRHSANFLAKENEIVGKGILLWLIGVPIPVILLLWLLFR